MLIPLKPILEKFDIELNGVAHVGAHWAEEHDDYIDCGLKGFLYVEPIKEAFEILSKKHIWKQYIYDKKGNTLYSVWYLPNGDKWKEFKFDKKSKQSKNKYYDLKGKLKSELITVKGKRVSEKKWNKLGELTKHKMYDKKGKLLKENNY